MSNLSEIMKRAPAPNTVLADALRGCIQDLDDTIRHSRTCICKDHHRKAEFLAEYLRLVRRSHELKELRQAESNIALALCEPHMPMPFSEQIVGTNKFAREWDMACMASQPAISSSAQSAAHWRGNRAA